jgi:hypothetical protein
MTPRPRYTCSFCGTSQDDTRRMIAGPQPQAAFICAACVQIATALLAEEQQEATHGAAREELAAAPVATPRPWWRPLIAGAWRRPQPHMSRYGTPLCDRPTARL